MDAYDCGCDLTAMAESFSYSNIAPQLPALNRGSWKRLEEYIRKPVRKYDSVLVWCGSVTLANRYIGKLAVPGYCWKILYIKKLDKTEAYSFLNDDSHRGIINLYKVSLDSIKHLSKLIFFRE